MTAPQVFLCPISKTLMEDPVQTIYGNNYERHSLQDYINIYNICPITQKPLHSHLIFSNPDLKRTIEEWKTLHENNLPLRTSSSTAPSFEIKRKKKRIPNSISLTANSVSQNIPNKKKIISSSSFSSPLSSSVPPSHKTHKKRSLSNPSMPAPLDHQNKSADGSENKKAETEPTESEPVSNTNNTVISNNFNSHNVQSNTLKPPEPFNKSPSPILIPHIRKYPSHTPTSSVSNSVMGSSNYPTNAVLNNSSNSVNSSNNIYDSHKHNSPQNTRQTKSIYTSSSYGRSILSSSISSSPPQNRGALSMSVKRSPNLPPAVARWYRRGRSKWNSFTSVDNKLIENAYKNPSLDQVFRVGNKGIVNIPERLLISDSGSSRQILRATWFCIIEKKLFPYPEALAERLEHTYQHSLFNIPIRTNDNTLEIQILSQDDMKEYTVGGSKDEYRVVVRGYISLPKTSDNN